MKALFCFVVAVLAACVTANIFDFEVSDFSGNSVSLAKYAGAKAILIGTILNLFEYCLKLQVS